MSDSSLKEKETGNEQRLYYELENKIFILKAQRGEGKKTEIFVRKCDEKQIENSIFD